MTEFVLIFRLDNGTRLFLDDSYTPDLFSSNDLFTDGPENTMTFSSEEEARTYGLAIMILSDTDNINIELHEFDEGMLMIDSSETFIDSIKGRLSEERMATLAKIFVL